MRSIGYNTRDSLAACRAYALHFLQDTSQNWTPAHDKVLYALYQKYD